MTGLVTLYLPYLSPSSLYPPRSDRRIVDINDTSLFLALRFVSWIMTTIQGARLRPHKVYMLSLHPFNWAARSLACRWGTCISSCFVGEWEPSYYLQLLLHLTVSLWSVACLRVWLLRAILSTSCSFYCVAAP